MLTSATIELVKKNKTKLKTKIGHGPRPVWFDGDTPATLHGILRALRTNGHGLCAAYLYNNGGIFIEQRRHMYRTTAAYL